LKVQVDEAKNTSERWSTFDFKIPVVSKFEASLNEDEEDEEEDKDEL
jgi:hypothetical protein